jgi:hypothetical protein
MANIPETTAALSRAGFIDIEVRDRNEWYRELARRELAALEGELRALVTERIGTERAAHFINNWRQLVRVLERGELRPAHLKACKPTARPVSFPHSALRNAGIKGHFSLVGPAFGGDNVRAFAARYGSDTAGLVLVEADVGGRDEHRGNSPLIAELRDCRNAIAEGRALPPLPAHEGRPPRTCAQRLAGGDVVTRAQCQTIGNCADQARGYHGIHTLDPTRTMTAEQQTYQQEVAEAQAKWLALSSNARQLFTDKRHLRPLLRRS